MTPPTLVPIFGSADNVGVISHDFSSSDLLFFASGTLSASSSCTPSVVDPVGVGAADSTVEKNEKSTSSLNEEAPRDVLNIG